jgi:hypothetical protein
MNDATSSLKIAVELQLAKFQKQYAQLQKLLGNPRAFKNAGDMISGQMVKIDTSMKKLQKTMAPRQVPFAGYALSIMFAGMAIQRTFKQITDAGTKTFQEISHSVYGTVTNTDLLEGSMKYLSFTIGAALEPLIGFLIPIVDAVSDWVDQNPELTAGIVAIGTALGALMMVGGGLKLALDGFTGLKNVLTMTDWGTIGAGISKALSLGVGAIGVYFTFQAAADAYDAFKSGDTTKGVLDALSVGFSSIGTVMALSGKTGPGAALIAIGVAFKLVGEDTLFSSVFSVFGTVFGIINGLLYASIQALLKWVDKQFNNSIFSEITGIRSNLGSGSQGFKKDFNQGFKSVYDDAMGAGNYYDQAVKDAKGSGASSSNNTTDPFNNIPSGPNIVINGPVTVNADNMQQFYDGLKKSYYSKSPGWS